MPRRRLLLTTLRSRIRQRNHRRFWRRGSARGRMGFKKTMLVMLDTNSMHSFVSLLFLPYLTSVETLEDPIHLTIKKLNTSVDAVPTKLVRFPLQAGNKTLWFKAYALPKVSFHSSSKLPKNFISQLKNYDMNHYGGFDRPVDLLIGITDLFQVFTGCQFRSTV